MTNVTRAITTTNIRASIINLDGPTLSETELPIITIQENIRAEKKALDIVKSIHGKGPVYRILEITHEQTVMGMSLETFLAHSVPMPRYTKKEETGNVE